jgi:putative nucleotidyltransferase with HDIG domain
MEDVADRNLRRDMRVDDLVGALEAYDVGAGLHSHATAYWCGRVAESLGMSAREVTFAALCGLLHDIGKISTPNEILLKAGPLDAHEWEIIRSHPVDGARMLESIPSLRELAPIVRSHHERPDGRGYPDRLQGASIPVAARIVAVADAYHAMISQRVYRHPYSPGQALHVLREGSETQWDGPIVNAMIASVRSKKRRLASA